MNANQDDALIRIRALSAVLNGKTIFDGVDLDIPRGRITAIMGPSGTGKTTLMRHITDQLAPDAGEVIVDGRTSGASAAMAFDLREDRLSVSELGAADGFSVFENIAFPLPISSCPRNSCAIVLTELQASACAARS